MDIMERINDLRARKGELLDQADKLADSGDMEQLGRVTQEMEGINTSIKALEALAQASREGAKPVEGAGAPAAGGQPEEKTAPTPFATLGEQLKAISSFRKSGSFDNRLKVVNEALGNQESVGQDGGFLIQTDFASDILASAYERSPLLRRYDRYTVSRGANSMRWISTDESDVSESVYGGVRMYWAAEAQTVAASHPTFREMKLDLEKMLGFCYVTDEMLEDAPFMTGFIGSAFSLAADQLLTASSIVGDGVGKPLGWMKSKAMIAVAKGTGQAAGTITGENVLAMLARSMPKRRGSYVWVMHPDLEEQLPTLAITNGDASSFLWNPEGGLGNFDTPRVIGRPVFFDENCSPVGQQGDINLIDPMQYLLMSKGTARMAWSIHVEFLTDQNCFRLAFRCNGAPKADKPMTIKNSTKTRSPFITLAART